MRKKGWETNKRLHQQTNIPLLGINTVEADKLRNNFVRQITDNETNCG